MIYLDDCVLSWLKVNVVDEPSGEVHRDARGTRERSGHVYEEEG